MTKIDRTKTLEHEQRKRASLGSAGATHGRDRTQPPAANRSELKGYSSQDSFARIGRSHQGRGGVTYRAGMAIDGDGSHDRRATHDPAWQGRTSLKWNGRSADANSVPYVVMSPSAAHKAGARLGDLVRVRANGREVKAIYADNGPRVGEASMRTARALGINDDPVRGGKSNGVEYTVLPGSGDAIRRMSRPPTFDEVQQA